MKDDGQQVAWYSYVILLLAVLMFSGAFSKVPDHLKFLQALDFGSLSGFYGKVRGATGDFLGAGGVGAKGGFLFGLSLVPSIALALGIVRIVDGYGGLAAAEKLISPLFKPLLGIPGVAGLAFITSLQSTDGAAGMTKELFDEGAINDKERTLFCMLQLSADGTITNYFSTVAGLFIYFGSVPIFVPLLVIFFCKFLGVNILRVIMAMDKKAPQA